MATSQWCDLPIQFCGPVDDDVGMAVKHLVPATTRKLLRRLNSPAPLANFDDYDEYWDKREGEVAGDLPPRWSIAADLIPDGGTVLDVGSGSAGFARYLTSKRPSVEVELTDLSQRAVELAREAGFKARQLDLAAEEIDGRFDVVTCFEVIEHIPDAEAAMRHLADAADRLIVSIPNVGYIVCRIRLGLFGRFPVTNCVYHIKEHVRFWTPRDFEEWLAPMGLRIKSIHGHQGLARLWRRWPRLFASGIVYELEPVSG